MVLPGVFVTTKWLILGWGDETDKNDRFWRGVLREGVVEAFVGAAVQSYILTTIRSDHLGKQLCKFRKVTYV